MITHALIHMNDYVSNHYVWIVIHKLIHIWKNYTQTIIMYEMLCMHWYIYARLCKQLLCMNCYVWIDKYMKGHAENHHVSIVTIHKLIKTYMKDYASNYYVWIVMYELINIWKVTQEIIMFQSLQYIN